jgi:aryl-alcohol dehydrogenase-like predicted oxidoreductase
MLSSFFSDCEGSPYYLDVLNELSELEREGYVRSVSGLNMPAPVLRLAHSNGFALESNQISRCNLLNPSTLKSDLHATCDDLGTKLHLSSPLAGGLFTDRHFLETSARRRQCPYVPWEKLRPSEVWYAKHELSSWAEGRAKRNTFLWQLFQEGLMGTLSVIALKHDVSMASVALRWALQQDNMGSVVVGSSFNTPSERSRSLRQVFTFELDEEDMYRLQNVAGQQNPPTPSANSFGYENTERKNHGVNFDGYELPDLDDKRLWL